MNDFLAALVGRAEGRLPVLERRPRSLFEPAAGVSAPSIAVRELQPERESAAPVSTAAERFSASPQRAVAGDRGASSSAAPPAPRSATNTESSSDREMRDEPTAHRSSLLAPDLVSAIVRRPAPNVHDERQQGLHAPLCAAAPTPPDETTTIRVTHPTPPYDDARSPDRQRVEARRVDGMIQPVAVRATGHSPQQTGFLQPRPTPPSQPAVLLAKAQTTAAMRRDPPPVAAPSPPPVQISIGRVEIRAVHAAADKPRAIGPAAPRLSLDDYLRARNGAGR